MFSQSDRVLGRAVRFHNPLYGKVARAEEGWAPLTFSGEFIERGDGEAFAASKKSGDVAKREMH